MTLALRAHTKGLELACHVLSDVPDALIGDPGRLRQIVVNLIGNAVKFTGEGEVVVRVEKEEQTEDEVCIHFRVKDTGIGIPSAKLSALFQAFSQVDTSTTRKYGGTGLGLAISSQLVKMMGGRIWVESKEGKRAELLNAIMTAIEGKPTVTSEKTAANRLRIHSSARSVQVLLTEDNAVNQKLAVKLLEKRGHRVILAGNGKEAIKALGEHEIDVILMDVQMPEMDGFEATQTIREREQETGGHIPIIAMTAHAMRGDRERCLEAGMDGYISKPLQPSELFEVVESFAKRRAMEEEPSPPPRSAQAGHASSTSRPIATSELEQTGPVFDRTQAMETVAGDFELTKEIIGAFLEEYPGLMVEIQNAISEGDPKSLSRAAHALKGGASALAAAPVIDAAQKLETMGKDDEISGAVPVHEALQLALAELESQLLAFCKEADF